jgi:diaminopimelate decarboxylase
MTSSELAKEVFSILETKLFERPSPTEFEMAYQMRVAGERIRFAIKAMDTIREGPVTVDEISLQLLDALDRLERLDRRFQGRSPVCTRCATGVATEVRA